MKQCTIQARFVVGLLFSLPCVMQALPMRDALQEMLLQNERILSQDAVVEGASYGISGALADWLPTLSLNLSGGYEKQLKPVGDNTEVFRNVASVAINQKVVDFGRSSAQYQLAKLKHLKEKTKLAAMRQRTILEGLQAYLNVLRAKQVLDYAIESEENIKKQTGMEEARVHRGSGLSTDVLQTKSTLAGAMATRVRAQGIYVNAISHFNLMFPEISSPDILEMPKPPYAHLPNTLNEALNIAMGNSLSVAIKRIEVMMARKDLKAANASFFPTVNLGASYKHRYNDGGVLGRKEETLAAMDVQYTPFAGGRDRASRNASKASLVAAEWQLMDASNALEEKVRSSWQNFMTAKANAQFLRNQADISAEFLSNARKERQLGKRSMMDLLSGETSYINTLASAVSAEADMLITLYTLFESMGTLRLDLLDSVAADRHPLPELMLEPELIGGTVKKEGTAPRKHNWTEEEDVVAEHDHGAAHLKDMSDEEAMNDLEAIAADLKKVLSSMTTDEEDEGDDDLRPEGS